MFMILNVWIDNVANDDGDNDGSDDENENTSLGKMQNKELVD